MYNYWIIQGLIWDWFKDPVSRKDIKLLWKEFRVKQSSDPMKIEMFWISFLYKYMYMYNHSVLQKWHELIFINI